MMMDLIIVTLISMAMVLVMLTGLNVNVSLYHHRVSQAKVAIHLAGLTLLVIVMAGLCQWLKYLHP